MSGVVCRPPSEYAFAPGQTPLSPSYSRLDRPAQCGVRAFWQYPLSVIPRVLLACCFVVALSGFSGSHAAESAAINLNPASNSDLLMTTTSETAAVSGFSCQVASMTGPGTESCKVTLSTAAATGGLIVDLSSSSAAVTLPATVTVPANATVATFSATVSSVATAQSVKLTADAGGVSKTFGIELAASVPRLRVATSAFPSYYGETVTLTGTITAGPTGMLTFYNGSTTIGTVPIKGTTATLTTNSFSMGSHIITVGWAGNSSYAAAKSGAINQLVNRGTPKITWAIPTPMIYGKVLSSVQLNASSSAPGSFVYSPPAGTLLHPGRYPITAIFTPTNSTEYTRTSATVSLAVNQAIPSIKWPVPAAIAYGTGLSASQLDATASVPGTFAYSPALGTKLSAGVQKLSVTFRPTDTRDFASITETVSLTVEQLSPAITWTTPATISYGTALSATQLNATSKVPGTFSYSPAAGTLLKAGAQELSVTFRPVDGRDYKTMMATVALTVNPLTPAITWPAPATITYGTALSATQLDATSRVAGTFAYSPAAGTVLKAGAQKLSVTFTPSDSTDYKTATATVALTVNQASSPSLSWAAPGSITYGTALSAKQLDATSTAAGTFTYSPAAGTVLKAGVQTLSVTFTPTNTTEYKTAIASVSLTVNQAAGAVRWASPTAVSYGTALGASQLNATSSIPGTFAYSPAAGTVLSAGTHTLSVTFTPTDTTDYKSTTSTTALTVNSDSTAITWATPAAITYGAALSATQLNATSNVVGTFAYSPSSGTVLKAGVQTLSVTFTPTNSTDYATTTRTVSIQVNQATPVITWATPAAVLLGTILGSNQLDATSTVPGVFTYSPGPGTIPILGLLTLSTTFTPSDTTDYTTATKSVLLTVNLGIASLSVNASSSVPFGEVALNNPSTQSLILTSTGTSPVTVSAATVTSGLGFSLSGSTLPETLSPGQQTTLDVVFDPTVSGSATGQLTITSTSATNGTMVLALTGTGTTAAYQLQLNWDAPSNSAEPVAGYNVYRASGSSNNFQPLNSSIDTQTSYVDSSVTSGQSYNYIIESVDNEGVESVPSNSIAVTIP
jgi:hypothetical protein